MAKRKNPAKDRADYQRQLVKLVRKGLKDGYLAGVKIERDVEHGMAADGSVQTKPTGYMTMELSMWTKGNL